MKKKLKSNSKINQTIKNIKKLTDKIDLSNPKFNVLEVFLVFIMALLFGLLTGEILFSGSSDNTSSLTTKNDEYLAEIKNVYNTITKEYINEVNKEAIKNAAVDGMMSALGDNYSVYYDEEESNDFEEELSGNFYGMGSEIYQDNKNNIIVNRVFENSPAEKAGLKKGDIYLKINNKDITKKTINEVAEIIKGKAGKTFTLTVKREDKELNLKVTTGKVEIPSVESKVIEKDNQKLGYIAISIFASNTDEQFEKHLKKLDEQNITKLIIDVRSNQGGELETVVNIASNFLNKKDVIVQTEKDKKVTKIYATKNNTKKYDIVMLINGGSASGSEVLASALNERYNAELIGTTTFGKGTVQQTKKLSNGTMIKYTIETWKTSEGKEIDKKGIQPTIKVELAKTYDESKKEVHDTQLDKAIEVILKK